MNKGIIYGTIAMAICVIASNILVQFTLGKWLTYGALTYPFSFLINDLTNRLYGSSAARRVIINGFTIGLCCSFVGTQIIGTYGPLVTLRIAIASGLAFLFAQLLDTRIFDQFRKSKWWKAPLCSTLIGSSVDTALFFTIAFSSILSFIEPGNDVSWANESRNLLGLGPVFPVWVSLASADFLVKLLLALIALIPFKIVIERHKPF